MKINVRVTTPTSTSIRARQACAMFDVPPAPSQEKQWSGDAPIEGWDWSVGLIVGPSGAGKSTLARSMFGEFTEHTWEGASLVDDFPEGMSIKEISQVLGAVGLNTIPSWLRPYSVLSTGEKFRADLARSLTLSAKTIVVDEFTSTVDRQVAKVGSHALQKRLRRSLDKRFVAVTCHYDVVEWLQPDWILEPHVMKFTRRSVQPRPKLDVEVRRVPVSEWRRFAPFHYLTASMSTGAKCYGLFVDGVDHPVAFLGLLQRPRTKSMKHEIFEGMGLRCYPAPEHDEESRSARPRWTPVRRVSVQRISNRERGGASAASSRCHQLKVKMECIS